MRLERLDLSGWDDVLRQSAGGVFHRPAALEVLDDHASGELRLYGAYKGQQPVGLLPVVVGRTLAVRTVLSPPPGFGLRELGPVLLPVSPKRRTQETLNRTFCETVVSELDADSATTLFRIAATPEYRDPRPFSWAGFDVTPEYTYRKELDSTDVEAVLRSFSQGVRRDVQKGEDSDVAVRAGGDESDVRNVYESIRARYDAQSKTLPISWEYVRDTVAALEDRATVYVAESAGGAFLSGIVAVYAGDTAYFWKGGTGRSDHDFSVNTLLHWRIMRDIVEDRTGFDVDRYDFHTANDERITRYKSQFNGELVPYYTVESAGLPMAAAKTAYRTVVR